MHIKNWPTDLKLLYSSVLYSLFRKVCVCGSNCRMVLNDSLNQFTRSDSLELFGLSSATDSTAACQMLPQRRGFTRRGRVAGGGPGGGRDLLPNSPVWVLTLSTARPDFTCEQRTENPPDPFNTLNQTIPSILSDNFRRKYFCWKSLRTVLRRAGLFYKDAIGYLPFRCLHSSRCVSSRYVI